MRGLPSCSINSRRSRIPRLLSTPRSTGPIRPPWREEAPPAKRVSFQLLPWKPHPLDLELPHMTRPPRQLLQPWDIRVRRYTSPTGPWAVPELLSPLPPSPQRKKNRGTQTLATSRVHRATQICRITNDQGTQSGTTSRVHRGTQVSSITNDQGTQSDSDWETTSRSQATQTEKIRDKSNNSLGLLKTTWARPPITYRERLWPKLNGPFQGYTKTKQT